MFEPSQLRKVGVMLRFSTILSATLCMALFAMGCDRNTPASGAATDDDNTQPSQEKGPEEVFALTKSRSIRIYSDGDTQNLTGDELHSEETLYVFWGIWCDVCHDELNQLTQWSKQAPEDGPRIVTVQNDGESERDRAISRLQEYEWPFLAVLPTDSQLDATNPANLTPTTVLVDQHGNETERWVGFGSDQRSEIQALFGEGSSTQ